LLGCISHGLHFHVFEKAIFSPYFLFLSAAFALLTPYLYCWNEQFHALAGKIPLEQIKVYGLMDIYIYGHINSLFLPGK
jgi:hypothetical protein